MTETEFITIGNDLRRNTRSRQIMDYVDFANALLVTVKELNTPARSQPHGIKTADRNAYMREYMKTYRQRQKEQKAK